MNLRYIEDLSDTERTQLEELVRRGTMDDVAMPLDVWQDLVASLVP